MRSLYRHSHRSLIMPSTGVTGYHAHGGGPHLCVMPWVPGLPEVPHSLTEDPEDR